MGFKECVGHASADNEDVNFIHQIADNADLVTDLGAPENGDERVLGMLQDLAQILEFFFHQ